MFDVSFSELLLIAVIALVVIGPKRLPETLRFVGLWVGRIKRGLARAYKEIDQELGLDEVRRQLHNEEVLRSIEEHKRKLEADIRNSLTTDNDTVPPAANEGSASTEPTDSENQPTPSAPTTENKNG